MTVYVLIAVATSTTLGFFQSTTNINANTAIYRTAEACLEHRLKTIDALHKEGKYNEVWVDCVSREVKSE